MKIRNRKYNKDFFLKEPIPSKEVIANIEGFFRKQGKGFKEVLCTFLRLSDKYSYIWPSQAEIAKMSGLKERTYCNIIIKKLEELGFISSNYNHMQTNDYKVSSFFYLPEVRSRLVGVLSYFRRHVSKKHTQLVALGKNIINILETSTKKGGGRSTTVFDKLSQILSSIGMKAKIPDGNPISVAVRRIKFLNLTKWGQITLCAFPDEAIYHSEKQTQYARNIRKPFDWYFKVCAQYCEDNNLPVDWGYVKELEEYYDMPDDPKMLKLACPVTNSRTFQKERGLSMYTNTKHTEGRQKRYSSFTNQTIVEIPADELIESAERAMKNEEYLKNAAKLGLDPLHVFNRTRTLSV